APGVTVSAPQLGGRARQVQAGAINSDNTNTFIDGISIKNLVNHGGTLGQNYSSGNPFPASAVDQFNVETQNFKAEFEQAGSAVISSITKTGGDKFHGEIFGEWQPKSFISENYDDRPGHRNNEYRYEGWWTHRGSNWLNEFIVARDAAANGQVPNLPGSDYIVTYTAPQLGATPPGCITVTGSSPNAYTCPSVNSGQRLIEFGNNFTQDDHQYQLLFKDNVTITSAAHTIKFGAKLNLTKLQRLEGNNVTGTYFFDAANFIGPPNPANAIGATINTAAVRPVSAKNTEIGLFVQDDWRPDDHLQVSAGV